MENKRTIIIGDIHGCVDEFKELINTLSYNKENDRIILLGDLIDRGNDSVGVIRYANEMNFESVIGNHEHRFLKWFKSHGSKANVYDGKPYYNEFSDQDINYIFRMQPYIYIEKYNTVIVHAGLKNGIPLENQSKSDLFYLRFVDKDSNFVSLITVIKFGAEAAGAHFWTKDWKGPYSVIYGHEVHSYDKPLIEMVSPEIYCYGLDTGCCFGGNLTAFILETKEIVQVKAKREYHKPFGKGDFSDL